jgi:hypothetical protein
MVSIQTTTTEIEMTDIEDAESDKVTLPSANLDTLPFDIQRLIVWDEVLSQDDVASLRLTCRGLGLSTSSRLFYRIGISKLNVDRQSFLSICHDPNLAKHVHEVEWLELSWDLGYFERLGAVFSWGENEDDEDLVGLSGYFHGQAKEAFWLPSIPVGDNPIYDSSRRECEESIKDFRETFMDAVDQLPNLHTFISRPMDSERTINPGSDYPMATSLLQTFQDMSCSHTKCESNDGLFLFIFPTMARPTSAVHRLRWADEFPGYSFFRPIPPSAFEGLESLDLCWTPINLRTSKVDNSSLTAACAAAAPTLRHLSLCLDHGSLDDSPGFVEERILGPDLAASAMGALQSLKLVSMNLDGPDVLIDIMTANAASLRHVHLENADARIDIIPRMAKVPGLRLSTFRVVNDYPTDTPRTICAHALLRHINSNPCDPAHADCDDAMHDTVELGRERPPLFVTTEHCEGAFDAASEADSAASGASFGERLSSINKKLRITNAKWAWARFYNESRVGRVYAFQVPSDDPRGHPTELWKLMSRYGEVGYGDDPFEWFEEWDTSAGDIEEPTPYCRELRQFVRNREVRDATIGDMLGQGHPLFEQIMSVGPPEGAIAYEVDEDPRRNEY